MIYIIANFKKKGIEWSVFPESAEDKDIVSIFFNFPYSGSKQHTGEQIKEWLENRLAEEKINWIKPSLSLGTAVVDLTALRTLEKLDFLKNKEWLSGKCEVRLSVTANQLMENGVRILLDKKDIEIQARDSDIDLAVGLKSKYERRFSNLRNKKFPQLDKDIYYFFNETKKEKIFNVLFLEFEKKEAIKQSASAHVLGGGFSHFETPFDRALYGYHCLNYYESYHLHNYSYILNKIYLQGDEHEKYLIFIDQYCFEAYFQYLMDYLDDVIAVNSQRNIRVSKVEEDQKIFVDIKVINDLRELNNSSFDLRALIKMCEEINRNFNEGDFLSVIALMRTIMNHVPPIFGCQTFESIISNYGAPKENTSFKKQMDHLRGGAKNLADEYLHEKISSSVKIPSASTVNYAPQLNNLLEEVISLLRKP